MQFLVHRDGNKWNSLSIQRFVHGQTPNTEFIAKSSASSQKKYIRLLGILLQNAIPFMPQPNGNSKGKTCFVRRQSNACAKIDECFASGARESSKRCPPIEANNNGGTKELQ